MKVLGIDQSINGTGIAVLEDGKLIMSQVRKYDSKKDTRPYFEKIIETVGWLREILVGQAPEIVTMEDYARMAQSASLVQLIELGGCIKMMCLHNGYPMSPLDQNANRVMLIQNQSTMKKFCLGDGGTSKDSGYLLKVMQRVHMTFDDDNKADAYMHAWMASIHLQVLRKKIEISGLPDYQQLALMGPGIKRTKGINENKALKLSEEQKYALISKAA